MNAASTPDPSSTPLLDARGYRCPTPVLLLEKALRSMPAGARLRVVADDPIAAIDIPHFALKAGASALREAPEPLFAADACVFLVTAGERPASPDGA